ncbi:MAG: histidine kinase [Lachnospiraceae bacterium]|nr:histidine kinase [Lachnospiraceae bacterium]
MKLRTKLLAIFLTISLLPFFIFLIFTQSYCKRMASRQLAQFGENMIDNASRELNAKLDAIQRVTEEMYLSNAENYAVTDYLQNFIVSGEPGRSDIYDCTVELQDISRKLAFFSPYINGFLIFTPSGCILSTDNQNLLKTRDNTAFLQDDWFQNAKEAAGDTILLGPSHKWFFRNPDESVSFCTALYGTLNQEFLGILFVDCSSELFDLSSYETVSGLTATKVTDNAGRIFYYNHLSDTTKQPLVFEKELSGLNLSLSFTFDQNTLSEQLDVSLYAVYYIAVFCLFSILLLSYFLSRMVTTPITALSEKMKHADLKQNVDTMPYFNNADEIGTLYNSYQKMLDDINEHEKKELELQLITLDAKMRSLEAQINAHFLYNTLEAINSIAVINKVPDISTMALSLGNMFRYSIKTSNELVPLSQELQHVRDYIAIQSIRFNGSFTWQEQVPEELLSLNVLKLILQPLVENALYHGLNYCHYGDRITLSACQIDKKICLSIQDNGQGMSEQQLNSLKKQLQEKGDFVQVGHRENHSSIGIRNINTRIALYYGAEYGLHFESQKGIGTIVTIQIPVYTERSV